MTTLTQCQQQVLDMLISYQKERGFPPTNQEVATMLGYPGRNHQRPDSTENASGIYQDAMPSMIAIILLIILHIWLCRQGGDHFWSESRLNISLLMLDIEHLARGKGLR